MYNYIKGGEQYRYATCPIIVTIPEGDPHYVDHCTDYKYISQTKNNLSKKLYELFGIHLDWHTFITKPRGMECWASSEVKFWKPGENISETPAINKLCFHRPLSKYLQKRPKIELILDYGSYWLHLDGDL
jgi:hypothetical protein